MQRHHPPHQSPQHKSHQQQQKQQTKNYQSLFNVKNHATHGHNNRHNSFSRHNSNHINHLLRGTLFEDSHNSHYLSSHHSQLKGLGWKQCPWQFKAPLYFQINVTIVKLVIQAEKSNDNNSSKENLDSILLSNNNNLNKNLNNNNKESFNKFYNEQRGAQTCVKLFTLREVHFSRSFTSCDVSSVPGNVHTSVTNVLELEMEAVLQAVYLLKLQGGCGKDGDGGCEGRCGKLEKCCGLERRK